MPDARCPACARRVDQIDLVALFDGEDRAEAQRLSRCTSCGAEFVVARIVTLFTYATKGLAGDAPRG
jgi:hypothetical protein